MQRVLIGVGVANVLLLSLLCVSWCHIQETNAALVFEPPTIAVIDVEAVVDGMSRRAQMEDEIRKELDSRMAGIDGLKQAVAKLQGEIKLLKVGSAAHQMKEKEIVFKQAELELEHKKVYDDLEKKRNSRFAELLTEIRDVTQAYCDERGIELVFQKKLTIQPGMPSWESVFLASDHLMITDPIIEILNKKQ